MEDAATAGQGLGNLAHEQKVLRAGEHETSGGWIFVHFTLNIRQKIGHMLDFVENDRTFVFGQKSPGIFLGKAPLVDMSRWLQLAQGFSVFWRDALLTAHIIDQSTMLLAQDTKSKCVVPPCRRPLKNPDNWPVPVATEISQC